MGRGPGLTPLPPSPSGGGLGWGHPRRHFLAALLALSVPSLRAQARLERLPPGASLPAWQALDLDGKPVAIPAPGKPTIVNFWASWCEPCRAEMPTLQQVADFYGPEKLLVLAINFKEPAARALQFAKTTGVTLPVLLDLDGKAARAWGVKVFPTTLMMDVAGRPRLRVKGEVDWTGPAAEKLIAGLLKP